MSTGLACEGLEDQTARERIRGDLDTTLVVEAAAGTGKTTELIARILAVIRSGKGQLEQMVAVTFTDKAAGEMKLRLRTELERALPLASARERARLVAALAQLEAANIGTIHAFCADLLSSRPVQAAVDPEFAIGGPDQAEGLFEEAFERWFEQALADPPEGVRRLLRRREEGSSVRARLRGAALTLVNQRDFPRPWSRPELGENPKPRRELCDQLTAALDGLTAVAEQANRPSDPLAQDLGRLREAGRTRRAREAAELPRDYDALEAELRSVVRLRAWKRSGRGTYANGLAREELLARRGALLDALKHFGRLVDADLASCLQRELQPVIRRYEALKAQSGVLDFLDLLVRARELLRDHASVRRELQQRFTHLFVDEFQDTDPLQVEILLLLCAEDPAQTEAWKARPCPGKLFVVGDPKQSIYRFRRADIGLYLAIRKRLENWGSAVLQLTTSFRALPAVQQAINTAFGIAIAADEKRGQTAYQELAPYRSPTTKQPALIALPVPRPYGRFGVTQKAVHDSLPDAVAALIQQLLRADGPDGQGAWTVTRGDETRPLCANDICLLFRRFRSFYVGDVTRAYARALEARRIPHVLVGGRFFHTREEVLALRTAMTAIEWPDDELSVYATLHGPLFSFEDDLLLQYKQAHRRLAPLAAAHIESSPESLAVLSEALQLLAALHLRRNRQPIPRTLEQLLSATRAHAGFAIWPTGEQALANVQRVIELARRFEAHGATSFRAFVDWLSERSEHSETGEAPLLEDETDGVRLMTVHAAKGLEFPVVILCDPTARRTDRPPSRYVDAERGLCACPLAGCEPTELFDHRREVIARDEAEEVRIAYVAATRARDLLVVPAVGDERLAGWVDVLQPALYPAPATRRQPRRAPRCPRFGTNSVVERPFDTHVQAEQSVAPGLHLPERGLHEVVWWDPHALALDVRAHSGLRQRELLQPAEAEPGHDPGRMAHEAWLSQRAEALAQGAQPQLSARAMTMLANEAPASSIEGGVRVEHVHRARGQRPSGRRFGTLVHAVLAHAGLTADPAELERLARLLARQLGAPEAERAAAVEAASSALAHPLFERARRSKDLRREVPVSLRLKDGTIAEGVADLVFRELRDKPYWVVVDFKTDAAPARHPEYARQLELYCSAVKQATDECAEGILLAL